MGLSRRPLRVDQAATGVTGVGRSAKAGGLPVPLAIVEAAGQARHLMVAAMALLSVCSLALENSVLISRDLLI